MSVMQNRNALYSLAVLCNYVLPIAINDNGLKRMKIMKENTLPTKMRIGSTAAYKTLHAD